MILFHSQVQMLHWSDIKENEFHRCDMLWLRCRWLSVHDFLQHFIMNTFKYILFLSFLSHTSQPPSNIHVSILKFKRSF